VTICRVSKVLTVFLTFNGGAIWCWWWDRASGFSSAVVISRPNADIERWVENKLVSICVHIGALMEIRNSP